MRGIEAGKDADKRRCKGKLFVVHSSWLLRREVGRDGLVPVLYVKWNRVFPCCYVKKFSRGRIRTQSPVLYQSIKVALGWFWFGEKFNFGLSERLREWECGTTSTGVSAH